MSFFIKKQKSNHDDSDAPPSKFEIISVSTQYKLIIRVVLL